MNSDGFVGQRGLQPERTALAWQRTTLGLLANGGLFALRSAGGPQRLGPSLVLAMALLGLAFTVAVLGRRRERILANSKVPSQLPPAREVAIIGWLLTAVCLGGAVVLTLPSG